MVVIGPNSDVARAFVEKILTEGERFPMLYLLTSNPKLTEKFAQHIEVKYKQSCQVHAIDLRQASDFSFVDEISSDLVFCASGFLGKNSEEGLFDDQNSNNIIAINYANLVVLLNHFAQQMAEKERGTIIALSSVAGERGRQSNFMYGSAKAGFTTYLAGLRNYLFAKKVHVLTVIPGFMDTQMTANIETPKPLTASPQQAANSIYRAYKKKKNTVYVSFVWRYIMLIIKLIPEFVFKRMKM